MAKNKLTALGKYIFGKKAEPPTQMELRQFIQNEGRCYFCGGELKVTGPQVLCLNPNCGQVYYIGKEANDG